MPKLIATQYCVKCGKKATTFGGHVIGRERMALGNLIQTKVLAGWCSEDCHDSLPSNSDGCYGEYNSETMGLIPDVRPLLFGEVIKPANP